MADEESRLDAIVEAEGLGHQVFQDQPGVSWFFTSESAPVQAEGTIWDVPFYFRARWDRWSFGIASDREPEAVLVSSSAEGYYCTGNFRTHRYSASYLPLAVAKEIIDGCIREYLETLTTG